MGYPEQGYHTATVPKTAYSRKYARFREVLIEARLSAGVTQTQLAKRLGRPQSFVSKFETGERRLDVVEFIEVARALDADPEDIISEVQRS